MILTYEDMDKDQHEGEGLLRTGTSMKRMNTRVCHLLVEGSDIFSSPLFISFLLQYEDLSPFC